MKVHSDVVYFILSIAAALVLYGLSKLDLKEVLKRLKESDRQAEIRDNQTRVRADKGPPPIVVRETASARISWGDLRKWPTKPWISWPVLIAFGILLILFLR
jgi:hypothetical protein